MAREARWERKARQCIELRIKSGNFLVAVALLLSLCRKSQKIDEIPVNMSMDPHAASLSLSARLCRCKFQADLRLGVRACAAVDEALR